MSVLKYATPQMDVQQAHWSIAAKCLAKSLRDMDETLDDTSLKQELQQRAARAVRAADSLLADYGINVIRKETQV
jgi:hypothetical protein